MNSLVPFPEQRWVRSPDHGVFAGVCAGLGRSFGVSPWILRAFWLLSVCALGTGLALYIVMAICLPREDRIEAAQKRRLLGVCARLSRSSGLDVGLVRTLTVLASLLSFGVTAVIYVVLYFAMSDETESLVY